MIEQKCKSKRNSFCYVCARYIKRSERTVLKSGKHKARPTATTFTKHYRELYKEAFGVSPKNVNEAFVPDLVCGACKKLMPKLKKDKDAKVKFNVPAIWNEPKNTKEEKHVNCYLCITHLTPTQAKSATTFKYRNDLNVDLPYHKEDDLVNGTEENSDEE